MNDLRGLPRKKLKSFLQRAQFSNESNRIESASIDSLISRAVESSAPLFSMRPGGTELMVLDHYLTKRVARPKKLEIYLRALFKSHVVRQVRDDAADYGPQLSTGETLSGISPQSARNHDEFSAEYLRCIGLADLLVLYHWTAWASSLGMSENIPNTRFESFDPFERHFRTGSSWLDSLAGKRVLVVSPFATSIEKQYRRKHRISVVADVLPDFRLHTLEPPVTFAGRRSNSSWFKELDQARRKMDQLSFDVVLSSAGAYGAPLAAYAKQLGKVGIHFGGSLPLLFGIHGQRWTEDSYYFLNGIGKLENWIKPVAEERPEGFESVEGGAYW